MTAEAASSGVDPRIQAECVRTLYRQIPNSFAAATVVTVYMVATGLSYTAPRVVFGWLAVQAVSQIYRALIWLSYRRNPPDQSPPGDPVFGVWARRYTLYMLVAGVIWGSTIFLFVHADEPVTLALTLCGLYGIAGGSVPGNAYHPWAVYAFVGTIFGVVSFKMLTVHDFDHLVLGAASFGFAGIMFMFCRVQHRTLVDGFAIRFENEALLGQLRIQKADAEEARGRAERANLAKSQFLAAASHDLRQPLYALGLFSASLQSLRLDDHAKGIVQRIQASIHAMESLFEGLLDVSKLDAGVIQPRLAPVSASALFDRLDHYFAEQAIEKGLILKFQHAGLWATADDALLERIVGNLVANAVRYTNAGRILVLARRGPAGRIRIEVRDSGPGIEANDQQRIFDEFVQIGNPERDRRKGLGLGLTIAHRSAALMDAHVQVRSTPGRGSVFIVDLPRAAPGVPAQLVEAETKDLLEGLRVLVVEDEQTVREGLSLLLSGWGVHADMAETVEAARALAALGPAYHVLLADYRLREGETGFDVVDAVQTAQSASLHCCLVTGDVDPALLSRAQARDLTVLHKPVRPAKLRAMLNHFAAMAKNAGPGASPRARKPEGA